MIKKKENKKSLNKWIYHINKYRRPVFEKVREAINFKGNVLEIGAGSCWFSSMFSREEEVVKIIAIDNDSRRLKLAREFFFKKIKAKEDKIELRVKDFHCLDFVPESFDFVVIDAALHHSDKLDELLAIIYKLLKKDGKLVAIREPILPSFFLLYYWRKFTFGFFQKIAGDVENIYSKLTWQRYFDNAGFNLEIKPVSPDKSFKDKIISRFFFKKLNGVLFSRYFFIAHKKSS